MSTNSRHRCAALSSGDIALAEEASGTVARRIADGPPSATFARLRRHPRRPG